MGRIITPDSEEGKELLKWQMFPSNWNGEHIPAGRPYVFRPYPRMLYKAVTKANGQVICLEPAPNPALYPTQADYERAVWLNDQLNKSCTRIVESEREHDAARSDGWRDSATDALAAHEALQQEIAQAAAETNFAVQRMSPKAQAEHRAAVEETDEQVTDLKPAKTRGRKRKPIPVSGAPTRAE